MSTFEEVVSAVKQERECQDLKWGCIEENPHIIKEWLRVMQKELIEANVAFNLGDNGIALHEVLRVVTLGVACLEQHGVIIVERELTG